MAKIQTTHFRCCAVASVQSEHKVEWFKTARHQSPKQILGIILAFTEIAIIDPSLFHQIQHSPASLAPDRQPALVHTFSAHIQNPPVHPVR